MPRYHPKKNAGATLGPSTPLLPVAERGWADAHECGELALTQTVALADRANIRFVEAKGSRRLPLTTKDRAALPDTREKLSKKVLFHGYSVSTIVRRARLCAVVRSDRSFFE
jgi:hypothetical protein